MEKEIVRPWLVHYPEEIPATIEYEQKPLFRYLTETAKKYPDKKALYFMGKEMTYRTLYEQSVKFADYLQSLGVRKGDRVSIMLPNTPQAVIAYYGALYTGAIVVQTNPLYTERELEYQMKDSGAKVIICLDLLYPRVMKIKQVTDLEHVIVTGIKDYLPFPKNLIYPFIQKKQYGVTITVEPDRYNHLFKDAVAKGRFNEPDTDVSPEEDLALLQYTGGTTGQAKGVMLTHHNLVSNTQMCRNWVYKSKDGEERILAILPFFHVFGMTVVMNLSIMTGSQMIILPKFEPGDMLKTINKTRPTMFPGAPTIYIGLLNHPDIGKYDLSSIDSCISGSAPLPIEVQDKFEKITGGKLVEGYGLTEASPVTHANFLWDKRVRGSIGVPWPDTDAIILNHETGEQAEVGEIGEIAVRGPQVMKGYWNRPDETAATFSGEWLLTGDLGYMDEDGFFYVVDRKKDMIIAGGYNIYPREIEEVLYEHEAVQEAIVAGIPDPYRGETVKAYIVLKEGRQVSEKELDQYCRKHLAAYKVPRQYEFRTELPKTAVGKILRRALVEEEKQKMQEAK